MMLDNFDNLCEDITVFEAGSTFDEDGKPTYTAKVIKGIWVDINKVIQTGLETSVTAKARILLKEDIADNVKIERGSKTVISTNTNAIIHKKVCRSVASGEFEGVQVFL